MHFSCIMVAGHREGVSCHVRMVSHGPVEVLGNRNLLPQRSRRMAMHENAWFKTLMPAPVGDILASVDQRRQLQMSVEGVSLAVLSTFNLGAQQQQRAGGVNSHADALTQPPLNQRGSGTARCPVRRRGAESQQVWWSSVPCRKMVSFDTAVLL